MKTPTVMMAMATGQTLLLRKLGTQILRYIFLLICIGLNYSQFSNAVEVSRPRGVSLTRKVFYDPSRDFTCLDGSLTIPFHYVNDDYCDCNDGTDEPGTAACPNGMFHCTNAGHKPLNIPSSRVNDGICDCCDSSDEYNSSANCVNYCKELGRQAREAAQAQLEMTARGFEVKQELIKKGKELKEERENKRKDLESELNELSAIKEEKDNIKNQKEELERTAVDKFNKEEEERKKLIQEEQELKTAEENERLSMAAFIELDVDQNGKITVDEIMGRWSFDRDKDGQVTAEEAQYFLAEKEEIEMEEFKTLSWPLIKPFYNLQQMFTPPEETVPERGAEIHPDPAISEEIYREQMKSSETEDDEEEEEEEEEEDEEKKNRPKFNEMMKQLSPGYEEEVETTPAPEPEKPMYDEETQALIDAENVDVEPLDTRDDAENARNEFREAERKARDVENELDKVKKVLGIDYGPNDEFSSLYEQCMDYNDHEYTYTLCFFDKTTQKPKDGSSINLGTWGSWEGGEENKYSKMKYDNGLGCWNGPSRSTEVRLMCGAKNELIKVSEPEKCKYLFDVLTPASCTQPTKQLDPHAHEEL